jgi:TM2 domain-containing membrane protein YozV
MTNQGLSDDTQAMMAFQSAKKSTGVAYLLWIFLGTFGAHRFYLGRTGSAAFQLILGVLGWFTIWFVVGLIFWLPLGIWLLVDLFLIPGIADEHNRQLMQRLNAGASRKPTSSPVDELAKFAELHKSGAISDEEYTAQKARLLGGASPSPASAG